MACIPEFSSDFSSIGTNNFEDSEIETRGGKANFLNYTFLISFEMKGMAK